MVNQTARYSFDYRRANKESKSLSETKRDFKLFNLCIMNKFNVLYDFVLFI